MEKYLKQTQEFDVELDLNENILFVLTKAQYLWENESFTSAWSEIEKNRIQTQTNQMIWNSWNNLVYLNGTEKSLFSKKKKDDIIPIVFNIQETNATSHWTVEVTKIHKGNAMKAYIQWSMRKICLTIEDSSNQQNEMRGSQSGFSSDNYSNSGNGNSYWDMHKEEFSSANNINTYSLGNLGNQLRSRYLELLEQVINDSKNPLMPKAKFKINNHLI